MSSSTSEQNSISDRPLWIALGVNALAILAGVIVTPLLLHDWFPDTAAAIWVGVLAPSIAVWAVVGLIGIGHVLWGAVALTGLDDFRADEEASPDDAVSPSGVDDRKKRPLPVPKPRVDEKLFADRFHPEENLSRKPQPIRG